MKRLFSMFRITPAAFLPLPALLILLLLPAHGAMQAMDTETAATPLHSLQQTIEILSAFADRSTGTSGNLQAAAYVRERLQAADPELIDSIRFQVPVVEHQGSRLVGGDREIPLLPFSYNAVTPQSLPAEGLQGHLVYGGQGELADFNGLQLKGAIVLLEFDSAEGWLNAASHGASALIYINRGTAPRSRFQVKEELSPLQFPCFWMEEQDLLLLDRQAAADPGMLNGMSLRLETSSLWTQALTENIYALFPGTDEARENELVLVEAFYDSSAYIPGRSPGADEALSIAGLLELADHLGRNPPERPFLLVASSGHAQELAGMRETIWAADARSRDLRNLDKQLKEDAGQLTVFIDLLEDYRQGLADAEKFSLLQKSVRPALKLRVDELSTELMGLRLREKTPEISEKITLLAKNRFTLRRLGWLTDFNEITPDQLELLQPLAERSLAEHRAILAEVKTQRALLKDVTKLRSLFARYEPRALISLHLSSHGSGIGAFHQGFLYYPLRPNINRTEAYRDIEAALQDAAAALPASAPAFISTLRPNRLRPWQDLLPDRPALGGEVSALAALPGITLATTGDIRSHWATPFDTADRINWDFAERQLAMALRLIGGIDRAERLETGYMRNGFSTVEGNTRLLLHGELFADHPAPETVLLGFQGLNRFYLMTDLQGRFLLKGVADKKHIQDKVILEGYRFDDDGSVVWAIDKRLTGKDSYRVKMQRNAMKTDLIMFQCLQTTIFNLLEPRSFRYMTKLDLIDGRREAPPVRYWYSRIDTRKSVIASIYLQPEVPLKLTLSDTVLKKKMILTNSSPENPRGRGYDLSRNPTLYNTSYLAAGDMWNLLQPRIENLEKHGIHNQRITTLQQEGRLALDIARDALRDYQYDVFAEESSRSWALASRVYDHVESTQKDVLFGVLFYIALFVPFAFCLERLLFGFVAIYKRIAAFTAILVLLILVISQVHPAFALAYSPTVVILAFFIIGLSFIVTMIISMRFEDEMTMLQRQASHKRPSEISNWKAFTAAFFLGVSNLRRRRMRTALTCLTLIILTFTIMSFTTVKSMSRQNRLEFMNSAPYTGVMVKNIGWNDLPPESLSVFRTFFNGEAVTAPRVWLEADERTRPLYLEVGLTPGGPQSGQTFTLQGMTGLSAAEPRVTGFDRILVQGRWFEEGESCAVLIPAGLADRFGYDPDDPLRSRLSLWGMDLPIVGVFSEERMRQLPDLDGEILTPATFPSETVMELSEVEQEALESGDDVRSFQGNYMHMQPDQILIVPAGFLLELGGRLKGVALGLPEGRQISRSQVEDMTDRFGLAIFSGEPGGVFLYTASETLSYSGMPNIIIPLLISILIVLNTMISSVYERKREIGVYTSVGLAPTHVSFLFIAEALAFAVLSVVLGYVLAQTSASLLADTGLWQGITVNYSSTAGVAAMILVIGVVLLSVIYPSRLASNIAIPDVNRSWSMPEIINDSMDITLPFLMRYHENISVSGFLYSYFKGHQDVSHGLFSTGPVQVVRLEDEEGKTLPMAAGCVHLRARVWLAPFDFGIMQQVDIRFCPAAEGPDFLEIRLIIRRMAGEVSLWQRANKSFLNAIRKQLLVWRSLDEEGNRLYSGLLPEPETFHSEKRT